jgi:nicotinamidase-related amidase
MEDTRKPARKGRATTAARPVAKLAPKAAAASSPARKAPAKVAATAVVSPARREEMIRLAAYFRAEQRGFAPGNEWEDWLSAEAELDALVGVAPAAAARKSPAPKTPKTRKAAKAPKAPKAPKA